MMRRLVVSLQNAIFLFFIRERCQRVCQIAGYREEDSSSACSASAEDGCRECAGFWRDADKDAAGDKVLSALSQCGRWRFLFYLCQFPPQAGADLCRRDPAGGHSYREHPAI